MSDARAPHGPERPQMECGLAFGLCVAPPLAFCVLTETTGTNSDAALLFAILPALPGLGMRVFGVSRMAGVNRDTGGGLTLGTLAGLLVGASLCVGPFTLDTK